MHQNFLEDENRSGAAEHGERLAAEQTEDPAGEQVSEKRLQHSLQPNTWLMRGKQETLSDASSSSVAGTHLETLGNITEEPTERDGFCDGCQIDGNN